VTEEDAPPDLLDVATPEGDGTLDTPAAPAVPSSPSVEGVSSGSVVWPLAAAAGSAALALAWPFMDDGSVQSGFFSALSTTSLTVFGIVFSLCLVGTQLISGPGRISPEHVFRPLTWGYLALFLLSALWGLSVSYYAGERDATDEFCANVLGAAACIPLVAAARVALFGFVLSLVLLFPYIRALYRGLTPGAIFTRQGKALTRARSRTALRSASRRFQRDLLGNVANADYVAEGVAALTWYASHATSRKGRRAARVSADEIAASTSQIFGAANAALRGHPQSLVVALDGHTRWIRHLIGSAQPGVNAAGPKQVTSSSLVALNSAIRNLRDWRTGDASFTVARGSVQLIRGMAEAASAANRRVRLSRGAEEIAECALASHQQGDERGLTMGVRALVSLARTSLYAQVDLGRDPIRSELQRVIRAMGGTSEGRPTTPALSALFDLHNYMHELTARPEETTHTQELVRGFVSWPWPALAPLVRGTAEQKKHSKVGSHSSWTASIYEAARRAGSEEKSQLLGSFLHSCYLQQEDMDAALHLFDDFATAYAEGAEWVTPLLLAASRDLAEAFASRPDAIPAARERRRTRSGMRELRS
jgi:hypothetical protein